MTSALFGAAWATFAATFFVAVVAFALFGIVLAAPALRGKGTTRKCACAASRELLRVLEERERAARIAREYAPSTVDVANLPLTSPELASRVRRDASRDDAQ